MFRKIQLEEMNAELKLQSNELGLGDLESSEGVDQETRIWIGFGLSLPNCFVFKLKEGTRTAFYIAPAIANSKRVDEISERTKKMLGEPTSGWDQFEASLKKDGVDSIIRLSMDSAPVAIPDDQFLVIESKSGKSYSMVYFSLSTESEDGKKALGVCQRIEHEFNISMYCGRGQG